MVDFEADLPANQRSGCKGSAALSVDYDAVTTDRQVFGRVD